MKLSYEKPAITYTGEVDGRAVQCAKASAIDCPAGPLAS
jgi:hypothetical protein